MRRPLFAAVCAVAFPATALLCAAAAFHLKLIRAEPAADVTLVRPPATLRLWFSQTPELAVTRVRLLGPAGPVLLGPAAAARAAGLVLAVRGPVPPGAYSIEWRTMSADGHAVGGRTSFRVGPPVPSGR